MDRDPRLDSVRRPGTTVPWGKQPLHQSAAVSAGNAPLRSAEPFTLRSIEPIMAVFACSNSTVAGAFRMLQQIFDSLAIRVARR